MRATAPLPVVGKHGKAAEPTGEMAESRKIARQYPFSTTMFAGTPFPKLVGPEALDAANECEHGFLPGDTPPRAEREDLVALWERCDCWKPGRIRTSRPASARVTPDVPKVETEVRTFGPAMAQLQVVGPEPAAVYVIDLPPFVANVVQELDDEQQRLTAELERIAVVRQALTEAP